MSTATHWHAYRHAYTETHATRAGTPAPAEATAWRASATRTAATATWWSSSSHSNKYIAFKANNQHNLFCACNFLFGFRFRWAAFLVDEGYDHEGGGDAGECDARDECPVMTAEDIDKHEDSADQEH